MDGEVSSGKKNPKSGNSGTLAQEIMTNYPPTMKKLGFLPTPVASDVEGGISDPRQIKNKGTRWVRVSDNTGTEFGAKLRDVAQMLPTPTARYHNTGTKVERPQGQPSRRSELNHLVSQEAGKNSQLNPLFVEEMMGFPENWTVLPFLNGEENQSKPTETQ